MTAAPASLVETLLALLMTAVDALARTFHRRTTERLLDPRHISRKAFWRIIAALLRSEQRLAREIHRTARQLAGLPAIHLPLNHYRADRPGSPHACLARHRQHVHMLHNADYLAYRLASRIQREGDRASLSIAAREAPDLPVSALSKPGQAHAPRALDLSG